MKRLLFTAPALLLGACLEPVSQDGPGFPAMCELDADCDTAAGEICDQGICWGDPPEGANFAAVLVPPDGSEDLVRTDVAELVIADDGSFGRVSFAETIRVSGRVTVACDEGADPAMCDPTTSIAAQIRVRRPSVIPGGPEYSRNVEASAGALDGEVAFSLRLPRLAQSSEPYEVTVVPQAVSSTDESSGPDPAALAPPVRFTLDGSTGHEGVQWILGQPDQHKIVLGRVLDAAERGIEGMKVYALGRWADGDPLTRSSSVSHTDENGLFALRIPLDMLDFYDLVALPGPGMVRPTLRASGVFIADPDPTQQPDNTVVTDDLVMPSHPESASFVLPIKGQDAAGTDEPVAGAEVTLTTVLLDGSLTVATYTASGTTNIDGEVDLELIPGGAESRTYLARVVPPPSSSHATMDQKVIDVGPSSGGSQSVLPQLSLNERPLVTGTVFNADGLPVAGATVRPRASQALRLSQDSSTRAALDNLSFPSVTTDDSGGFRLWVDPVLLGLAARYDLELVPPADSAAPRWSLEDLSLEDLTAEDGMTVTLPPPSFARGEVVGPDGEPVSGAELWLFQLSSDEDICPSATLPGGEACAPPALLRGLWPSREDGIVWLVLPDTDAYSGP